MGLGNKEVYGSGVNLQNITSFGTSGMHGMTSTQISAKMAALVFKARVWGVPYGLFDHNGELTPTEVGYVLDGLVNAGATMMTNTQLVDAIYGMSRNDATTYYTSPTSGPEPDMRPTSLSPVVNAGTDLGANFKYDLIGYRPVSVRLWLGDRRFHFDTSDYISACRALRILKNETRHSGGSCGVGRLGAVCLQWIRSHERNRPVWSANFYSVDQYWRCWSRS